MRLVTPVTQKGKIIQMIVKCDHCGIQKVVPPTEDEILNNLECTTCGNRGNKATSLANLHYQERNQVASS